MMNSMPLNCVDKCRQQDKDGRLDVQLEIRLNILYCCQVCLERRWEILGELHLDTLISMHNLANTFDSEANYPEADALYANCLQKRTLLLGADHPDTLSSMYNLAVVNERMGKFSEAEGLYVTCLQRREATLGESHPDTLWTMAGLGK